MSRAEEWKTWRKANNLSQRSLSNVLDLERKTVQNIESGRTKPSYTSQRRFEALKERYTRNAALIGNRTS